MIETIEYRRPDGRPGRGYLAAPRRGTSNGIVVIQEWWGLNDQICGVADRFARAGYAALAPDLYEGRTTTAAGEASHMMDDLDFHAAVHQDVRAAAQCLSNETEAVAVIGFCLGGILSIAAAVQLQEVSAAICCYGVPSREVADAANIRVPLQGHFADADTWCTPAAVDALETTLKEVGADYEFHRYDAHHGFMNERDDTYDVSCAELAWERTLTFLRRTLS